jgi:hypothetical protein
MLNITPCIAADELQYLVSEPMIAPCVIRIDLSMWNIYQTTPTRTQITQIEVAILPTSHPIVSTPCPTVPGIYIGRLLSVNSTAAADLGTMLVSFGTVIPSLLLDVTPVVPTP